MKFAITIFSLMAIAISAQHILYPPITAAVHTVPTPHVESMCWRYPRGRCPSTHPPPHTQGTPLPTLRNIDDPIDVPPMTPSITSIPLARRGAISIKNGTIEGIPNMSWNGTVKMVSNSSAPTRAAGCHCETSNEKACLTCPGVTPQPFHHSGAAVVGDSKAAFAVFAAALAFVAWLS
ncbi:hypothetical protein F4808DRAFT_437022 [Astrocystis sublimbata]|nr:hypothetical protein F4808DRAFT_437022 [Astrocystis sublimbata]